MKKPTESKTPKPPAHLGPVARAFFAAVVDFYDLTPHQLSLLISACEAKDRSERCRAAIAKEGATTADRWGQLKPHPLLAVEAVARGQFYLGYRALGLDIEPTGNVGRPPGRR